MPFVGCGEFRPRISSRDRLAPFQVCKTRHQERAVTCNDQHAARRTWACNLPRANSTCMALHAFHWTQLCVSFRPSGIPCRVPCMHDHRLRDVQDVSWLLHSLLSIRNVHNHSQDVSCSPPRVGSTHPSRPSSSHRYLDEDLEWRIEIFVGVGTWWAFRVDTVDGRRLLASSFARREEHAAKKWICEGAEPLLRRW